ncbi:hypothetical protein C2G38_2233161 [Gigaspora rosea]|uniref:Uncharacterized protein n=1 Tax=Gigaspora rosea TaxID=44941 RepID=A0A397U0Z3_9GLOM|nr:hypothetical protein C2G38_2233161 [Gigaspora rosea]
MSNLQKWQNANGPKVVRQLAYYYKYISELAGLFLESYSLCSLHYTQIVSTNQFYKRLVGSVRENPTIELDEARKLLKAMQLEN